MLQNYQYQRGIMKRPPLGKLLSHETNSIKETMKIIDKNAMGVAFIVDEAHKLVGVATDGDIRRAIIKGKNVETPIKDVMNQKPVTIKEDSIDLYDNPNFEFVKGDIRNIQTVMSAIKNTDAVIHLAAIVGDPACALNAEETVEINYLAAKMIAEMCKYHQINRFLFASTCSVYGASTDILTEESTLNPVS